MLPGHIYRSPRGPVRILWLYSVTLAWAHYYIESRDGLIESCELRCEMEPLEAAEAIQHTFAQVAALHIAPKPPKKVKKATA